MANPLIDEKQNQQAQPISPTSALAYGLAGHAGTAGIDALATGVMSELSFRNQRRLMRQQYALEREKTKNLMSDERESYIKAGLNPNLLAEGGFSAPTVSASQPAQQNISGKGVDTLGVAQQKVLANTLEEQSVEIEGKRLENAEQKIINDRLEDEDKTNDFNTRAYMEMIIDELPEDSPLRISMQNRLDAGDVKFTAGSIKAINDFTRLVRNSSSMNREVFENRLQSEVVQYMLAMDDVKASMAIMPRKELEKANAYIQQVASAIAKNYADARLAGSEIDVNRQVIKKMQADIKVMAKQQEMAELQDSRYLVKTGRWHDFATNVFFNGIEFVAHTGESLGQGLAGGYGFSKGASVAKGAGISPALSRNPITAEKASKLPSVDYEPYSASRHPYMSAKELSKIPLSERKRMASIEYNQFRASHPRMGDKKMQTYKNKIGEKYGVFQNPQNRLRK